MKALRLEKSALLHSYRDPIPELCIDSQAVDNCRFLFLDHTSPLTYRYRNDRRMTPRQRRCAMRNKTG
jgi:hypothetical protein